MSPAAVDVRSSIASQKNLFSATESRQSSGFDFGEVFPGAGGEFRRSESVGQGKSRPRLVKVRKQVGLQHPRSRGGGGGNGGFVFGADRSGAARDVSEADNVGFVFGSRQNNPKPDSFVEKEESFAKLTESNKDSRGREIRDTAEVLVFGGNNQNEVKKSTYANFVFGDSWFNSNSYLGSQKNESCERTGTKGVSKLDDGLTPFVFGSSSNVTAKVGDEVKPNDNAEAQVQNPGPVNGSRFCNLRETNDNSAGSYSTGLEFKLPDEMWKLNIDDESEKTGVSSAKLFSTSRNVSKPTRRRRGFTSRNRVTDFCDKSSKGRSFGTENSSTTSKLNSVSGTSGPEPFTFHAGVGETDKFGQIHKGQGIGNTEPKVSSSSNYPRGSVNFVEEKNYTKISPSGTDKFGGSSVDPSTPIFNSCSLRESLFPKLDKKMDVTNRSAKDKRLRDTRRKSKNPLVKNSQAQDNASKGSRLAEETNASECYSPMDFSPYQESASTPVKPNIHSKSPSASVSGDNGAGVGRVESAANFSWLGDTKSYMFSATPTEQIGSSVRRHRYRRRSRIGVGNDTFVIKPSTNINPELSSAQSSPLCQNAVDKAEAGSKLKQGQNSSAEVRETCENWRIRGNEAYKNGDISKAEALYTQGIISVPSNERTGNSLEPLLLCYSNRAAARMRLQRVREAIGDCTMAISLDPNFLKAHSRAANCHLLLGEIEQSLQYFSKCLEIGAGICLDRKIILDAVDGQRKAQKVAESTVQSAKLLEEKSHDSALSSLEIISKALSICPYSEKLIKLKADALIMVRRHEAAIQLCEQSLSFAEKNFTSMNSSGSDSSFRLWRWFLISKSYFLLGRLETALPLLDKIKQVGSIDNESARRDIESGISLETTVRGLLHTKNAGNEAFKSGRYSEAVDHYTLALSSNVESRHFAAICFSNRAAALQALGQIADAIADCSLAIALDGNYRKAVSRRAILHEMIRDYGEAASDLQRLISIIESQPCDKPKESGSSGRSAGSLKELRQAQMHLPVLEQEAKSGISMDFYLILGCKPDDTSADIKKAYRKAALKHHPDKAGQFIARSDSGDEGRLWKEISQEVHKDADKLFKMIGEAYAVLSDSSKRSQYDLDEELRKAAKASSGSSNQRRHSDAQYSSRSNSYARPDFYESSYKQNFRDHWKTHGNSYSRW